MTDAKVGFGSGHRQALRPMHVHHRRHTTWITNGATF